MTKARAIIPTDAEIDAARERASVYSETATKILTACFDAVVDAIIAELSTGATITVPRTAFPHWNLIEPAVLTDLEVEPGGFSVWSEAADVGVRIEGLISAAAGPSVIKGFGAATLGRATSTAKAAAVRENGKKGGRPRNTQVTAKPLRIQGESLVAKQSTSPIYIERRPQGDYAGRKAGSQRASFVAETQREAIARARHLGGTPLVARVRGTNIGSRDKWRKA